MMNSKWIYKKRVVVALGAAFVLLGQCSLLADWECMPPITPMEYRTVAQTPQKPAASRSTDGTIITTNATEVTDRIKALARSLDHNPLNIFNFVRNEIEYQPGRGIYTGADGCLQIKKGNDWDQSALLAALLRESGYSCYFETELVAYNRSDLANWIGVDTDRVETAFSTYRLSAGGITDYATMAYIERCWVNANINGSWKRLDPAFEHFSVSQSMDWMAASGYNRTAFLNGVKQGATIADAYVKNLNKTVMQQKLTEYTANLSDYINQNGQGKSFDALFAGRQKIKADLTELSSDLPHRVLNLADSNYRSFDHFTGTDILSIRVQHAGIDKSFKAYEYFGNPLVITYNPAAGNRPELYLDGQQVAYGSNLVSGSSHALLLSSTLPTSSTETLQSSQQLSCGGKYELILQFMDMISSEALKEESQKLSRLRAEYDEDSVQIFGSSMRMMELYYIYQRMMMTRLLGLSSGILFANYNQFGVCGEKDAGLFFDLPGATLGQCAKNSVDAEAKEHAAYLSSYPFLSALEHGALEQIQNKQGVSTARLLTLNNDAHYKTFYITQANWSSIQGQLPDYSLSFKNEVTGYVNAGYHYLLPQDPTITLLSWSGKGYIRDGSALPSMPMGMLINGGYYGGYAAQTGENDASVTENNTCFTASSSSGTVTPSESKEPVDLFTGHYLVHHADLGIGKALPLGMHMARSYNSGQNSSSNALGNGWSHNLEMRVAVQSRPQPALGESTPEAVAAQAVQAMVCVDLMEGTPGALEWLTACMVADWAMSQLTGNAATVTIEGKTYEFLRQPDGSYLAPGDCTATLTKPNGVFVYQERNGRTFTYDNQNQLARVVDPDGNQADFVWSNGHLSYVEDEFGRRLTFNYTGERLRSVSDSTGRSVHYQYDAANNLTNVVDAAGFNWGMTYDSAHRILALTDPEQITTIRNHYNALGQVTNQVSPTGQPWDFYFTGAFSTEESPLGYRTTTFFDEKGRNIGMENAAGEQDHTYYDAYGQVTQSVNQAGLIVRNRYNSDRNRISTTIAPGTAYERTTTYLYDEQQQLAFVINPLQQRSAFTYDANHHLIKTIPVAGASGVYGTTYAYDQHGRVTSVTEEGSRTTTFTYDAYDNPLTVTSSDAGTIARTYDSRGNRTETIDQAGIKTRYYYNALNTLTSTIYQAGTARAVTIVNRFYRNGLLMSITDAAGNTRSNTYSRAYELVSAEYPDGTITTNRYDADDRLIQTRDPKGNWTTYHLNELGMATNTCGPLTQTEMHYDSLGQVSNAVIDPTGLHLQTHYTYNILGQLTDTFPPIGHRQIRYDILGRTVETIDSAGKAHQTAYDNLGRVSKTIRPSGATDSYQYDKLGNMTTFQNSEGHAQQYGYNKQGQKTSWTTPLGEKTIYVYSPDGTLAEKQTANGEKTCYQYDGMKRITNITHDSAWKASFCYDVNGNMVRQCSPMVTNTYAYDCMNRMTSTTQRILSTTYSVSFQYDANGNRTNITYYPNYSVGYSYDAANRLEQVRGNYASQVFHFSYDGAGRLTELSYFNGITNQINYDANGQITRLQHGTFIDRQMVRDARGFVTSVAIQSGFPPPSPYACDNAYAYNAADQMTGHNSSGECGSDETSYTFNPNGCLSSTVQASQTNTYTYDFNNRFLSASFVSGDVLSVCYDAAGTRVGVATTDGWHFFIVDPSDPYKRPLVEYTDQGAPVRYYMWAGNRLLYHHDVAGFRCYHPDEQGSTLALSDDSGNVTDQFAYLPYGAAVHVGPTKTPFQWLGGYGVYYDGDSELHLTLHRAYSAKDKRFLSQDPIGLEGGPNLYWYGDGNPLMYVDPLGLSPQGKVMNQSGGFRSTQPALFAPRANITSVASKNYGFSTAGEFTEASSFAQGYGAGVVQLLSAFQYLDVGSKAECLLAGVGLYPVAAFELERSLQVSSPTVLENSDPLERLEQAHNRAMNLPVLINPVQISDHKFDAAMNDYYRNKNTGGSSSRLGNESKPSSIY